MPTQVEIFFVTAVIRGRRHLLVHEGCARTALESLAWLRGRGGMDLFGFVVLPSRLHFLCRPKGMEIAGLLARFESFTSARMANLLRRSGRHFLMQSFHAEQREDSLWEPFRTEALETARAARTKLEYLHALPLCREWKLAGAPEEYPFSSACYYVRGNPAVIEVDDLRILLRQDADLVA